MKTNSLTKQDKELISLARKTIRENKYENKSVSLSVGSVLQSQSNKIYRGVNIESKTSAPTSICAEMSAISQMVSDGDKKIKTIVAVYESSDKKIFKIFQPCGACRHIISQFGNPFVIISKNKKVKLNELYPLPIK
jgi:cytidine deaminase